MSPTHEDFAAVRRQAEALRDWFARETGWVLQVERDGARLYKRPADLGRCHARPARLRSAPLRAAVPGLRGARTRRRADHAAPARRAAAAARRRAGARGARLHLHARPHSTSGANWWRCAARCSTSACCSAWPATRRPSCRPAASRPMRCTTCSAARSPACWRRCAGHRPGATEDAPAHARRAAACPGRRTRGRQRRGPAHGVAPPARAPAARRSRGLCSRRWIRTARAYFVNQRGADGGPPVRRHRAGAPSSAPKGWRWSTRPAC